MFEKLKRLLSGRTPREVVVAREQEITTLQHDFNNCLKEVQTGRQIIQSLSNSVDSHRRVQYPVAVRSRTRVVRSPS